MPLPSLQGSSLVCAAIALVLTSTAVFLVGHRLRRGHALLSLLTIGALAAISAVLQRALTGDGPSPLAAVAAALAVGGVVIATWRDWNPLGHACFTATAMMAGLFLGFAVDAMRAPGVDGPALAVGAVLFALQTAAMSLLLVHTFEILDVLCRTRWKRLFGPKYVEGYYPKVSIHVPIHREPPELVRETLDALAALDYPDFEVLVIDNNTDEESLWRPVEEHCVSLGPRFRFFHLNPWPGFKSGALNFALTETAADAELIGIVDADYIVEPGWLADLTGHFHDPEIAFVQTPQDYRDVESRGLFGRALALSYNYFFRISMASRNEFNAIIFAGTMGLLRKQALVDVGGWDEWCITEDAEISVRLLNAGHGSVFVDRTYGRGLMPVDYAGLKKQRFRWAFGGMQLLRQHARVLFLPWARGRMTQAQRAAFVSSGLQWLNDPLTLAFTTLVVATSGLLLWRGPAEVHPLLGPTLVVSPLFLMFSLMRFLWALRVRERTTYLRALQALVVLLGLSWVVALACFRGLVSKQGVFLRTPKQDDEPRLGDALRVVRWELALALASLVPGIALVQQAEGDPSTPAFLLAVLLFWQASIYFSSTISALWNLHEPRPAARPASVAPTGALRFLQTLSTWRRARRVGLVALVLLPIAALGGCPSHSPANASPAAPSAAAPSPANAQTPSPDVGR